MLSAFANRIPIRLHIFTGQVWSNKNLVNKFFLKLFDKLIIIFLTKLYVMVGHKRIFNTKFIFKKIKVLGKWFNLWSEHRFI